VPTHEIKTRFRLEGEQQYRNAMSEAAAAIKVLSSEQRLAKAEFEATGDAQQYAADQARIFEKQIEEQKKAVAAAESAVRELTERGISPSAKEFQAWQTKLNNARTTLSRMESQLKKAQTAVKDQNGELKTAKTVMAGAEDKVKALTAEEKLAEAQFKETGDQEAYAADKTRILREKVDAQREAVAAAETAIKSMTDNGVDPASEEMVEWKNKLADAKLKLANMEDALDDAEKELKDQTGELGKAKTAMTEAEGKVKSLTKEEKLAEAQFKATGDKETYAAEKTRILKEKIEAQKEAVKAAEKAIKSMTDNGVDPASAEMVEWKDKLVEAKTKLANMETALNSVESELSEEKTAFDNASGSADSLKASVDKAAEKVDFQNVISSIDDLTGHVESAVRAVGRVAKALWNLGSEAGGWADDVATAAAQLDIDPETYQSWQYASQFIDTSVTDITKSWQDIQKNLKENNTEYLGQLSKLGVGSRRANGTMRTSEEIFWDIIDALHNMKDPTEQARVATELFGNDWRTLKPLIDSGSQAYKDLAKEGKALAVVSNENVEKLGAVDDSMAKLKSQANKLKNDALAALSPSFIDVSEAGGKAVTALQEFLESAEGKQAVDSLNEAISDLLKAFLGEDNGQGTIAAVIDTAKKAVEGFTNAMKWISENGDLIKGAVMGLGIAFAGLKITKGALEFMTLLQAIPIEKLKALFSLGGGSAVPSAASSAASSVTSTATSGTSFGTYAAGVTGLAVIGYGFEKAAEARQGDQAKLVDTAEHLAAATNKNSELLEAFEEYVKSQAALEKASQDWTMSDEEISQIAARAEAASKAFLAMDDAGKVLDAYRTWRDGNAMSSSDWVLPEDWEQLGLDAATGLKSGLEDGQKDVEEASKALGDATAAAAMAALDEHSPSKVMETIGGNASVGLANGIYARADEAIKAAQWLADQVAATFQAALDIHSPSGVFEDFGEFTALGYAGGLEKSLSAVERAVGHMTAAATRRPVRAIGGLSMAAWDGSAPGSPRYGSAATSEMLHLTIDLDGDNVADVMAPLINGKIGAMVQATRRN